MFSSGTSREENIERAMKHYVKIFPNVSAHFDHNDATVTKMVGNFFDSCRKKSHHRGC